MAKQMAAKLPVRLDATGCTFATVPIEPFVGSPNGRCSVQHPITDLIVCQCWFSDQCGCSGVCMSAAGRMWCCCWCTQQQPHRSPPCSCSGQFTRHVCEHEAAVYTCFIETVLQLLWLFVAWLCTFVMDGFWLPKLMFVLSLEFHCRWPTHGWCDECAHCLQSMQRGSDSSWSSSSSQQGMGMVRVRVRRNPRTAAQQAVLCSRCRRICNVLL
jgi:hypothetical protein